MKIKETRGRAKSWSPREHDISSNKGSLEKRNRLRLSSRISSSTLSLYKVYFREQDVYRKTTI